MTRELSEVIKITPDALKYLKEKNKLNVKIEFPEFRSSGETVMLQMPEIHGKLPKNPEFYHQVTIDGITVYVARNLNLPMDGDVVIDLDKVLGIRMLKVSGFNLED